MPGKFMRNRLTAGAIIAVGLVVCATVARADLVESWENNADGWLSSPFGSANQQANFAIQGFSTTSGVTNATYSMAVGATATNAGNGPDYSHLLISPPQATPYALGVTNLLANASNLKVDLLAPPGS